MTRKIKRGMILNEVVFILPDCVKKWRKRCFCIVFAFRILRKPIVRPVIEGRYYNDQ